MTYIIIAIIAVIAILYFTGKKSAHSELIINAPTEKVWAVLTDFKKYPEWNPTMQLVKGEVKEGNKVVYHFTQDEQNAYDINAKVQKVIPHKLLNQKGGIPFILTFNHRYILEPQGEKTKMIIHEDYGGIGVNFWSPKKVEKAYERLNLALKKRVEEVE